MRQSRQIRHVAGVWINTVILRALAGVITYGLADQQSLEAAEMFMRPLLCDPIQPSTGTPIIDRLTDLACLMGEEVHEAATRKDHFAGRLKHSSDAPVKSPAPALLGEVLWTAFAKAEPRMLSSYGRITCFWEAAREYAAKVLTIGVLRDNLRWVTRIIARDHHPLLWTAAELADLSRQQITEVRAEAMQQSVAQSDAVAAQSGARMGSQQKNVGKKEASLRLLEMFTTDHQTLLGLSKREIARRVPCDFNTLVGCEFWQKHLGPEWAKLRLGTGRPKTVSFTDNLQGAIADEPGSARVPRRVIH